MENLKIEKGIKIVGKETSTSEISKQMDINDSIFFKTKQESATFYQTCVRVAKGEKKFISRSVEGGYRVWRVS